MNLAFIEFRDMQGWSPEDDIDGLDTNGQVASEAVNVDFGHGYFRNMKSPITITLPSNVSADIVAGYSLLSAKDFTHTTEGDKTFYVLWNNAPQGSLLGTVDTGGLPASVLEIITGDFSSVNPGDGLIADGSYCIVISIDLVAMQITIDRVLDILSPQNCYDISVINKLKFYLDNDAVTLYFGNSTDVEIQSKPEEINYNFVNNQLKINLNCDGYSPVLGKTVILNLSLQFLEPKVYVASSVEFAGGWYLCPRWLGAVELSSPTVTQSIYELLTDGNLMLSDASLGAQSAISYIDLTWMITLEMLPFNTWYLMYRIEKINHLQSVIIRYPTRYETGTSVRIDSPIDIKVVVSYGDKVVFEDEIVVYSFELREVVINASTIDYLEIDSFTVAVYAKLGSDSIVAINGFVFNGFGDLCILAYNHDKQRSKLINTFILPPKAEHWFTIKSASIDWRIDDYELYIGRNNLFIKFASYNADDNLWVSVGNYVNGIFSKLSVGEAVETLNFNYGLGATVDVSTQSHIYMETFYRNRVYFVKDDFKVYFSHISGTGRAQPDSFPYDDDVGYGFLETKGATKNKAIAVDVTDNIVIIQEQGLEVYAIEYGTMNVMRKLRVISGETGIGSRKSLLATLNGTPTTTGLIWSDVNGIYIYAGGIAQPTNLTYPSIKKYYNKLDVADKENAVGFYNPILNEYWLQIGSSVLIFEIPYRQFRTRSSALTISSYVGDRDNAIRVLGSASNMFSVASNDASDAYIAGYLTSHYTSGYQLSGQGRMFSSNLSMDKLMQEVYVMFGACAVGQKVTLRFYIDGVLLSDVITILAESHTTAVRLAPLAVKFGKAKLKLTINGTKLVTILSFGFTSDIMSKMLAGSGADVVGTGYGSGYGTDYGDNL